MAVGTHALFQDAVRFDRHLTRSLRYRGPELLHDAVRRACSLNLRPFRFGQALDGAVGAVSARVGDAAAHWADTRWVREALEARSIGAAA